MAKNKKIDTFEEKEAERQSRKRPLSAKEFFGIFRYVLPYKYTFLVGLIFLVLSTATTLVFPYFASVLADSAVGKGAWTINDVGLVLLLVLVLQGIFSYARIYLFAVVSERSMADIRRGLYEKLIRLPLDFFEQRRVGELTSRLAADVTQLQSALSINLAELFRQIATLIAGIGIIAFTSLKLTAVMLSTFPVAIIAAIFFGKFIRKLSRRTQDALAHSNVVVEESLQSIQVVKAFTNEWFESKRYGGFLDEVVDYALQAARYRGLFVTFMISAVFGGIILVLWTGASYVESGDMTIGELIRFILYTFFIGASVGGLGSMYGDFQRAIGASDRIASLLDEEEEVALDSANEQLDSNRTPTDKIKGSIYYKNVAFSYPTRKDVPVLKDISFKIEAGQKVALVGSSGAGKSTIVQLLMRFYKLDQGQILVGDQAIENFNVSHLRSHIGIVPQEVMLFGGTIAENISYGKLGASEEEIIEAAKQANAWEFIQSFPEGLSTLVGERGVKLSGGQRQRIAIARAILKDPAILLLDEATSSLDAESEKLVQDALNKLMEGRTSIIIAHRLATIRMVDKIYVLDKGQIVEEGNHADLVELENGLYKKLLKLQFAEL